MPSVLHILPTFDSGGLGSLGFQMIAGWPIEARHMVVAPRYRDTKPVLFNEYIKCVTKGNVAQVERNIIAQPPAYVQALAQQLRRMQAGHVPDVVINYNFSDAVWNVQAVRLAGFMGKFLCHVGTVLDHTRKDVRLAAQSKFHWNTTFVPASYAARDALVKARLAQDIVGDIAAPVWNGVDSRKFFHREPGYAPAPLKFGFTGRMANPPVKDWDMLLEGFRAYIQMGGNGVLRIAGDGPLFGRLKRQAEGLPVEFVGLLDPEGVIKFLAETDVFVMAALPIEGFSMALVEAIVARCMVITTDVPSVRELFATADAYSAVMLASSAVAMGSAMLRMHEPDVQMRNRTEIEKLAHVLTAETMARQYARLGGVNV